MHIKQILDSLASTSSRVDKEDILCENRHNKLLKESFRLAYDPSIRFYIKQIPNFRKGLTPVDALADVIEVFLPRLYNREVTGNTAKDELASVLETLSVEDQDVLIRIISKDLRCGVSTKTINNTWKDLIPQPKIMLASTDVSTINFPCYIQEKMDGVRVNLTRTGINSYVLMTRNGKPMDDLGVLFESLQQTLKIGETLDGEIVFGTKTDEPLPRKISNGLTNKMIKGTISETEMEGCRLFCWDLLSPELSPLPYKSRLLALEHRLQFFHPTFIRACWTDMVQNEEDAQKIFHEFLSEGKEGVILKNCDAPWEGKRSKNMVKLKDVREAEFRCIGWEEGTGKYQGLMGALIFGTDDQQVVVSCGSGFSDKEREQFTKDTVVDKIATLMYNAVIDAENRETKSLFLPRFVEFREDKNTTNTLNEL